ncbi:MAG TPA: CHRD domain-containing protein [Capillimicrobium sp.]|nr:CHRD domain-containing protein [Capillimicrobium sp.]
MSRRTLAVVAVAAAALPTGLASAKPVHLEATLNGRSEVPRTDSRATGHAEFTVADNRKSIRYELDASGLSGPAMAAHLHLGKPGQAGGVLITIASSRFSLPSEGRLTKRDFSATGNVKTFRQAIRAVLAGRTYVNIHTAKFPAGEIRGQVRAHG